MVRGMATLGGEAAHAAHDSELAAALLALNAVFVVARPDGPVEVPALRFLKQPAKDLEDGGLLTSIVVPGSPQGTALERVAVLPSAPSLLSVAATISFSGDAVGRARVALTGLTTPPARVLEGESRLEGSPGDDASLERCVEQVLARAPFRADAHAPEMYRRAIAGTLVLRALRRAMARARAGESARPARQRPPRAPHAPTTALPYFTSGRIELSVNGDVRHFDAEARTSLLDLLRREGYCGVKHGCETGECGACAVLLDGRPVNSCLTLALRAHGRSVTTVEGLGTPDRLHPIQSAFVETGAIQCGYCTPAMELCAKALLDAIPDPTEAEAREALAGCLCRCTGYVKPVEAVLRAARLASDSA
jgi:aerobic-type carbon monoxide dehydrogenase small subunit (CoxS/CutS family)